MKPLVLKAQAKELYDFLKGMDDLSAKNLVEANMKILKMQQEIHENLKNIV